jgi:glycosyltransferase involved in cell wall biosynthesis
MPPAPLDTAPLVAVIIPTFNRLPFLQGAVESVLAQTLDRWELIVVDDGSDDGSWRWLTQQSFLRPFRFETRRGPSAARNLGARQARAPLLAWLDSDDLFLPEKLARQTTLLNDHPELVLCHSNELWVRSGRPLAQQKKHEKRGGAIFAHCLPMCRISPSATMIRRNIFEELGGFAEELEVAEDYELWLRLTCRYQVGFIDEPLIIKRGGHPDQLSMKYGQIEKFRIAALQRVLERAPLSEKQRLQALTTLAEKCEIYARGCEKRARFAEAAHYRALGKGQSAP